MYENRREKEKDEQEKQHTGFGEARLSMDGRRVGRTLPNQGSVSPYKRKFGYSVSRGQRVCVRLPPPPGRVYKHAGHSEFSRGIFVRRGREKTRAAVREVRVGERERGRERGRQPPETGRSRGQIPISRGRVYTHTRRRLNIYSPHERSL